jgi:hypothetical protein
MRNIVKPIRHEGLPPVSVQKAYEVSFKEPESLTVSDLDQLQLHACNMSRLLRYGKSDATVERKADIRQELNRVVTFLFQYNINLTNLLQ